MKNYKKIAKYSLIFFVLLIVSCTVRTRIWQYSPNEYNKFSIKNKADSISVVVFEERLNDKGISSSNSLAAIVPFLPYGTSHISVPTQNIQSFHHDKPVGGCVRQSDTGEKMIFNPPLSFSYALVSEFEASGIFNSVGYVCKDELAKGRFVVVGKILDISMDKKFYTYGLGLIGAATASIIGLPIEKIKTNLSVKLTLIDTKLGIILFENTYTPKSTEVLNTNYSKKSEFTYADMLSGVYREFIASISPIVINKR